MKHDETFFGWNRWVFLCIFPYKKILKSFDSISGHVNINTSEYHILFFWIQYINLDMFQPSMPCWVELNISSHVRLDSSYHVNLGYFPTMLLCQTVSQGSTLWTFWHRCGNQRFLRSIHHWKPMSIIYLTRVCSKPKYVGFTWFYYPKVGQVGS